MQFKSKPSQAIHRVKLLLFTKLLFCTTKHLIIKLKNSSYSSRKLFLAIHSQLMMYAYKVNLDEGNCGVLWTMDLYVSEISLHLTPLHGCKVWITKRKLSVVCSVYCDLELLWISENHHLEGCSNREGEGI